MVGFMIFFGFFFSIMHGAIGSIISCPIWTSFGVQQNLADLNASGYMKEFE